MACHYVNVVRAGRVSYANLLWVIRERYICPKTIWPAICCLFLWARARVRLAQTRFCTLYFIPVFPAFIALEGPAPGHDAPEARPAVFYALHLMWHCMAVGHCALQF